MFKAIKKDPKNFLLAALLVIAIFTPITAVGTIALEHHWQNTEQVGAGGFTKEANSPALTKNSNSPVPDESSLSPDEGGRYQDRQGNPLEGSHLTPRIVFRDEGKEFSPFIAIFLAIIIASGIAYLIGFRSARKRER